MQGCSVLLYPVWSHGCVRFVPRSKNSNLAFSRIFNVPKTTTGGVRQTIAHDYRRQAGERPPVSDCEIRMTLSIQRCSNVSF